MSPRLQVIVPAYFYPAGEGLKSWQNLIAAAPKVKIVIIANPGNGPGDQRNLEYFQVIKAATEKGVTVIGYVSTKYGGRSLREIQTEFDRWIEFYPQIGGFFLDQQSAGREDVGHYLDIHDQARRKLKNALIVSNPGTVCDDAYFSQNCADVTCIFANYEGFDQYKTPTALRSYSRSRFAALAYQVLDAKAMRQMLQNAIVKRIGYVYISDSPKSDNPWARLPTYWEDEVDAVSQAE